MLIIPDNCNFQIKVSRATFYRNSKVKIVKIRSIIVGFSETCRSSCPLPCPPLPRECMQSIHSSQLFPRFSVAGRSGKSMVPTVKGIVHRRHACAQFYARSGLIKLIKTSLVRASAWALANSRAVPGIEILSSSAPLPQELPANQVSESSPGRL